jgi:hypothetical protein
MDEKKPKYYSDSVKRAVNKYRSEHREKWNEYQRNQMKKRYFEGLSEEQKLKYIEKKENQDANRAMKEQLKKEKQQEKKDKLRRKEEYEKELRELKEKQKKMSNTLFNYITIENHEDFAGMSSWELNAWYMVYNDIGKTEKLQKIKETVKLLPHNEQYIFKRLKPNLTWE